MHVCERRPNKVECYVKVLSLDEMHASCVLCCLRNSLGPSMRGPQVIIDHLTSSTVYSSMVMFCGVACYGLCYGCHEATRRLLLELGPGVGTWSAPGQHLASTRSHPCVPCTC